MCGALDAVGPDEILIERREVDLITGGLTGCVSQPVVVDEQKTFDDLSRHHPLLLSRWERRIGERPSCEHLDDGGGATLVVVERAPDRFFQLRGNDGVAYHVSCPP